MAVLNYRFTVKCPRCDSPLDHVNGNALGTVSTAIMECPKGCGDFEIVVRLRRLETGAVIDARGRQRRHRAEAMA